MNEVVDGVKRAIRWTVKAPILAYRYTLSPAIGHVCRFYPTCSVYALEAIETHGAAKGLWLTVRRLSRCHPITWLGGRSGIDPVPPRQSVPSPKFLSAHPRLRNFDPPSRGG